MIVCSCNVLSDRAIRGTVEPDGKGPRTAGQAYRSLGCRPDCGRCATTIRAILAEMHTICAAQCASCHDHNVACAAHVSLTPHEQAEPVANDLAAAA